MSPLVIPTLELTFISPYQGVEGSAFKPAAAAFPV
jgi:hypothetical protein